MNEKIGIYVHIPFCVSKCYYCDFCSFEKKEEYIEKYIDALTQEILSMSEVLSSRKIETIYIGGGTPSYVDSKYIVKIMKVLSMFYLEPPKEVTIELNPNSVTEGKIKEYLEAGINRFSIGLQCIYDDVLKIIGRTHKFEDYINCLNVLKNNSAENISTDLIYPLPNLDFKRFKAQIDKIINLSKKYPLKHISVYNLEVHEGTKLDFLITEGYVKLADEDEEYKMKDYLENSMMENGFNKYEISNYAILGYESLHNTNYWKQNEYLGFGLNASSFSSSTRYSNTKNLENYIDHFLNGNKEINVQNKDEEMDKLELMKEYVILGLRLKEGLQILEFKNKFKVDIFSIFKDEL
ncbi:MAG: radical SAM family heme chaperone HemW, partial [Clostridia bacterium]|nr:radical SAM family heme chaperone HemW [Clostridia bacterium]